MYLPFKLWDGFKAWLEENNIKETNYHEGCFNGPNSIKILKKSLQLKDILPENLKRFADVLNLLNEVRINCFGQTLHPDYDIIIKNFEKEYRKLGISVTVKAHVIFTHCIEFFNETNEGLGAHSEQAGETLHSDFLTCWARYKRDENHKDFYKQFLSAIVAYNSSHI